MTAIIWKVIGYLLDGSDQSFYNQSLKDNTIIKSSNTDNNKSCSESSDSLLFQIAQRHGNKQKRKPWVIGIIQKNYILHYEEIQKRIKTLVTVERIKINMKEIV